jgi:serine/threonine protein kinase
MGDKRLRGRDSFMMTQNNDGISLRLSTLVKGTFKIIERLASSELSIVYLGSHAVSGDMLIIKEFYPIALALRDTDGRTVICRKPSTIGKFTGLMEAFAREALILQQLSHNNIVDYIDHFEENGTRYLVTGYCHGLTLDRYIREGKPSSMSALLRNILLPLVDTLEYIHTNKIIHRDCKPANIIISEDGRPQLLDFGSAVFYEKQDGHAIFTTTGFSPLELYSEKTRQGAFSDMFSISAVIYFCLTGCVPIDVSQRLFKDSIQDARNVNKEISHLLSAMIKWGLAVQFQRRCPSLKLIKAALYLEYIRLKRKETRMRKHNKSRTTSLTEAAEKNPTPL